MGASASRSNRRRSCWGVYESALREDASMFFPERFRACLGEETVIVRLRYHALAVIPLEIVESWTAALISGESVQEQSAMRFMLADAEVGEFDSEGCLALTKAHCEWAALIHETSLRLIGVGDRVEIWSQAEWEAYHAGAAHNDPM